MKFDLNLIPSWAYWIAIGTLVAGLGVQEVRISGYKTAVAKAGTALALEQKARSAETTARSLLALAHGKAIAALQFKHAEETQLKENDYAAKIKDLEASKHADAVVASRLRDRINAYAAGDRRPGETDAAAVQRYANQLKVVSGLLGESVDLVVEGRAIIGQRDAEVGRLLDQISIDRVACTAPAGTSGVPKP